MLKNWTDKQFKEIEKAVAKHFRGRTLVYDTGGERKAMYFNQTGQHINSLYKFIDNFFGLAYTSTGIFACYGVCNIAAYFDQDQIYKYSYFTIGNNGKPYAILQDNEENEICIEL